jgi:hypothetical protein
VHSAHLGNGFKRAFSKHDNGDAEVTGVPSIDLHAVHRLRGFLRGYAWGRLSVHQFIRVLAFLRAVVSEGVLGSIAVSRAFALSFSSSGASAQWKAK